MLQGITTVKALILSAPRPSKRTRPSGRTRIVETVKFITDDGKIGVFEQPVDENPLAKGEAVQLTGYGSERDWEAANSGRKDSTLYISDLIKVEKAQIDMSVFAMKPVDDFVRVLGAQAAPSVD